MNAGGCNICVPPMCQVIMPNFNNDDDDDWDCDGTNVVVIMEKREREPMLLMIMIICFLVRSIGHIPESCTILFRLVNQNNTQQMTIDCFVWCWFHHVLGQMVIQLEDKTIHLPWEIDGEDNGWLNTSKEEEEDDDYLWSNLFCFGPTLNICL